MTQPDSRTRRTSCFFACALLLALPVPFASALSIDLSLNLIYSNPQNAVSAGTWELVAKTDGAGLAGISAYVTGITTAQNIAPRGVVNGSDPAGFAFLGNTLDEDGFRKLTLGQVLAATGPQQTAFYGVGTLTNGAPNFTPGQPPGTMDLGPEYTALVVQPNNGVPWAVPDPMFTTGIWATSAKLASGPFAAGVRPAFYENGPDFSRGTTFLSAAATNTTFGPVSDLVKAGVFVRDNLVQTADYNHNGVVDAADYVVWRDTLGQSMDLRANGDNTGPSFNVIDQADYLYWRANFGMVFGPGAASDASVVPEPTSAALVAIGAAFAFGTRRRRSPNCKSAPGRRSVALSSPKYTLYSTTRAVPRMPRATVHGLRTTDQIDRELPPFRLPTAPIAAEHTIIFRSFSGRFSQLRNSSEKRSIEGGNCLTASKTANIMPKGSRTAGVSTSWGHLIGRRDCAS